jgi:hypothetical protein
LEKIVPALVAELTGHLLLRFLPRGERPPELIAAR